MNWTSEIEDFLKYKASFLGAWNIRQIDRLIPRIQSQPLSSLIINSHHHWMGLIICGGGDAGRPYSILFNSLGIRLKLAPWEVKMYKKLFYFTRKCFPKMSRHYFNRTRIQASNSILCGMFASLFIFCVDNRKQFYHFLRVFRTNNRKINDRIVLSMVDIVKKSGNK